MLFILIYISTLFAFPSLGILVSPSLQIVVPPAESNFEQEPKQTSTPTPTPMPKPPSRYLKKHRGGHAFRSGSGRWCDPTVQEQLDVSGTYLGTVTYPAGGFSGDATLAVNGNEFILSRGERKLSGQFVVVRTCDYTAIAIRFNEASPPVAAAATTLPMTISVHAAKQSNRLSLISVPEEPNQFTFTTRGEKRSIWKRVLKIWKWF